MRGDNTLTGGEDSTETPTPYKSFHMPSFRTFVVRKWNADHTTLVEIVLEAHLVQFIEPDHVQFIDFEIDADTRAPTSRLHRIIYNVEDVEDVDRPIRSRLVAH